MATTLPLHWQNNHLFLELAGGLWLIDTGAPTSFGTTHTMQLESETFHLPPHYLGFFPAKLSELIGVSCVGLLGMDVLGRFDHIFHVPTGTLTVAAEPLTLAGTEIPLDEQLGIPIVTIHVAGEPFRVFWDTGAQISYLPATLLQRFPPAGPFADFYPGVGRFETSTHTVPINLGSLAFTVRCGSLPGVLDALLLSMTPAAGILGNAIIADRPAGFFPRRRLLVL